MEATGGVGSWDPAPTQALINAVHAAGFNTIRIPCAWASNANASTYQINASYMAAVTQVVQWALNDNMTVIINDHWDNGWFEDSNFSTYSSTVNAELVSFWTQIANNFKSYSSNLIFACANEPQASSQAQTTVLFRYYQNFVNAVRATGGDNSVRWLALQGPGGANLDDTFSWVTSLPYDPANHLIVEVHFYAPYQYVMMTSDASWGDMWYFWGSGYNSTDQTIRNATSGLESYVQSEFQEMKTKFTSNGVPVMVGEFGAINRTGNSALTGSDLTLHLAGRTYWDHVVVSDANNMGLKPVYWDDGGNGNNSFGIFDRITNSLYDPNSAQALTGGAPQPPPGGTTIANGTYKIVNVNSGLALDIVGASTSNGSRVDQWPYHSGTNQQWTVTSIGNNLYTIASVGSGKCMDVYGWGTGNGTEVDIWQGNGGANQEWQIVSAGNGSYTLIPANAPGEVLDVPGSSTTEGTDIDIWQSTHSSNQEWMFHSP